MSAVRGGFLREIFEALFWPKMGVFGTFGGFRKKWGFWHFWGFSEEWGYLMFFGFYSEICENCCKCLEKFRKNARKMSEKYDKNT